MGFIKYVSEVSGIFASGFTGSNKWFFMVFSVFLLTVLFLVYFDLLRKGIKPFLIFWGVLFGLNIFLAIIGLTGCSSSSFGGCMGSVIALGFSYVLFWSEFVPPLAFLLFKLFKPGDFVSILVLSLISSTVAVGILGIVVAIT